MRTPARARGPLLALCLGGSAVAHGAFVAWFASRPTKPPVIAATLVLDVAHMPYEPKPRAGVPAQDKPMTADARRARRRENPLLTTPTLTAVAADATSDTVSERALETGDDVMDVDDVLDGGRAVAGGPGVKGGSSTAMADATQGGRGGQAAGLADGMTWDCPFPAAADLAGVNRATVVLEVTIDAKGTLARAVATTDPGHGFADAATRCATHKRWRAAVGADGRPHTSSALVRVQFAR